MSQTEAIFLLCGYPVLIAICALLICGFTRALELSVRDNEDDSSQRDKKSTKR